MTQARSLAPQSCGLRTIHIRQTVMHRQAVCMQGQARMQCRVDDARTLQAHLPGGLATSPCTPAWREQGAAGTGIHPVVRPGPARARTMSAWGRRLLSTTRSPSMVPGGTSSAQQHAGRPMLVVVALGTPRSPRSTHLKHFAQPVVVVKRGIAALLLLGRPSWRCCVRLAARWP